MKTLEVERHLRDQYIATTYMAERWPKHSAYRPSVYAHSQRTPLNSSAQQLTKFVMTS